LISPLCNPAQGIGFPRIFPEIVIYDGVHSPPAGMPGFLAGYPQKVFQMTRNFHGRGGLLFHRQWVEAS